MTYPASAPPAAARPGPNGNPGRISSSGARFEVAGWSRAHAADPAAWPEADVAIDFSTSEAVPVNFIGTSPRAGLDIVIGTTGWQPRTKRHPRPRRARRHRRRRRTEFRPGGQRVRRDRRACRAAAGAAAAMSGRGPHEAPSRRQEGCAVGHRARSLLQTMRAAGVHCVHRCVLDAGRRHSREPTPSGSTRPRPRHNARPTRRAIAAPSRAARSRPLAGCRAGAGGSR